MTHASVDNFSIELWLKKRKLPTTTLTGMRFSCNVERDGSGVCVSVCLSVYTLSQN